MSKKRVSIEARLDDYVSKNADAVKSKLKGITDTASAQTRVVPQLSGAFNELAASFGPVVLAYKALAFGKESIDEYAKEVQATAKLEQVVRATGGAAGYSAEQLGRMADAMESYTIYGGDMVKETQTMLLTFKNISGDVFPRALDSVADMATMFGGLDSSSIQLGKALNDPIQGVTALSRVGVQFTEQQKQQIKKFMDVNNIAGAQGVILKELEGQFGGVARAMAQTDVGRLQQQKNVLGNIKEEIGKEILPAQLAWNEATGELLKMLAKATTSYGKLFEELGYWFGGGNVADLHGGKAIAESIAKASEMESGAAVTYLKAERQKILDQMKDLKKQQEEHRKVITDLENKRGSPLEKMMNKGQAKNREAAIKELDAEILKINEWSMAYYHAINRTESLPKQVSKTTTDGESSGIVKIDYSLERQAYENHRKWAEEQVKAEWEAKSQKEKEERQRAEQQAEALIQISNRHAQSVINLKEDSYVREMELLILQQEEETRQYAKHFDDLSLLEEAHRNQITAMDKVHQQRRTAENDKAMALRTAAVQDFASMFGNTLVMIGQATKADAETQKRFAQLQAVINTAVAISEALATPYLIPLIAAQGAAQVAIINQQKFAQGGIVAGPRHPVDTVPIRASGREMMLNERQQRNLFNMISKGGGSGQGITLQLYGQQGDLVETLTAELRNGEARPLLDMITQMVGANV